MRLEEIPMIVSRKREASGFRIGTSCPPEKVSRDTVCFSGTKKLAPLKASATGPVRLIRHDKRNSIFTLTGKNMEYHLQISPTGELVNLHWGKPVGQVPPELLPHHRTKLTSWQNALDVLPREYPDFGRGDNRTPAIQIVTPEGQSISHFKVIGHRIMAGKPELKALPSLYAAKGQAQTLVVKLRDESTQLELDLNYTVFKDADIIVRSARLVNRGKEPVSIEKLASISADFNPADYRLLKLSGSWARERQEELMELSQGQVTISSRFGASGHEHNPFVALLEKDTDEYHGNVYGFSLLYSGSFSAEAEQNRNRYTRLVMGINPFNFKWKLAPGEAFQTPEAIGFFSSEGLNGMSRQLHRVFNNHLIRSEWKDKPRPVRLNSWEAAFMDINHEKIIDFTREAKKLGADLVVVDDGWFGVKYPRNRDVAALGDWRADPAKFPKGIGTLAKEVNQMGMLFGLWIEPEMINRQSELYEKHSDWIIHQKNRPATEMRNQLILDFGRKDVQDHMIRAMSKLLDSGHIQYIKWDMNRSMTEVGSAILPPDRQAEVQHRYMLGLYRVLDVLTKKYPKVLFEGCAGGGGRFDAGMLQYFPQIWTSDNTDAASRLNIQAGTLRAYPAMTMGAHVTQVPNVIVDRTTSLKFRFHVAMAANLGLELDPTKISNEDKKFIREQISFYKSVRHIIQKGQHFPLRSPAQDNWPALIYALEDGSEALVFAYRKLSHAWGVPTPSIRLRGLQENALYSVSGIKQPLSGGYLMNIGLTPQFHGDFDSHVFHIKRIQ